MLVVREHRVLSDVCPPHQFLATESHGTADRVFFLNSVSSFDIIWMYDGSVHNGVPRWIDRKSVTFADAGDRVVRSGDAFFLHPRGGAVTVLHLGEVRENRFVRPVKAGWNFVGNPWPVDRHAAPDQLGVAPDSETAVVDLRMTLGSGFNGSQKVTEADQVQLWKADQSENYGLEGYTGYYLLDGDFTDLGLGIRSHWTKMGVPDLADENTALKLQKCRGMFLRLGQPISDWVIPDPGE